MKLRSALACGVALLGGMACSDDSAEPGDGLAAPSSGAPAHASSSGSLASSSGDAPTSSSSSSGSVVSSSSGGSPGGGASGNGSDKPNCNYTAHATGLQRHQQVGGLSFHTYAPSSYDAERGHAVVFVLHSQDSDGVGELQAFWQSLADSEELVLVAPKGSRSPTDAQAYPNGANWTTGDLNYVAALVEEIDDCYNVDVKRHLLWGFSAGASVGYLLGLGATELFSGLAMSGSNTAFARSNGYAPAQASWKIPVSHVHGAQDRNPIGTTRSDRDEFRALGHTFTLHEHPGGHSITAAQVAQQWNDLKDSRAP